MSKKVVLLFLLVLFTSCSDGPNHTESQSTQNKLQIPLMAQDLVVSEKCSPVSSAEKINPLTQNYFDFYTLSEDTSRFQPQSSQSVYVIGDIHGSWKMIVNAVVNSGVMEFDIPEYKTVTLPYQDDEVKISIPNLKYRKNAAHKVIFVGDYIAKSKTLGDEQRTVALLTDILAKGSSLTDRNIVAILGNHDLEAVNDVEHPAYGREKAYQVQIQQWIDQDLVVPTYYLNGIWYSHSYLTPDDIDHLHDQAISFFKLKKVSDLGLLADLSTQVNTYVKNQILSLNLKNTWLASSAGSSRPSNPQPVNFFYAMDAFAADGNQAYSKFQKFPMIIGHLSDLNRKVIRVLTEGYGGGQKSRFRRRAHVLCVDTSIYHSYETGSEATFLKVNYGSSVQFESCQIPTQ